jgi:hypothetical protein
MFKDRRGLLNILKVPVSGCPYKTYFLFLSRVLRREKLSWKFHGKFVKKVKS